MSKRKDKPNFNGVKECTYYIDGMHCASCEVLIEKKVLKKYDVEYADASLSDGELVVKYKGENKPEIEELNKMFKESGYQFSNKKFYRDNSPIFSFDNNSGLLTINREKFGNLVKVVTTVIGFLIIFKLIEKSGIVSGFSVSQTSSYPAFFIFGILAGLSSCAALVGGLLLSLSKQWTELYIDSESKIQKFIPFTMFNIGRIISFTVLGAVLGLLGDSLGLSQGSQPVLTSIIVILTSILMAILGLQMLGVEWASKLQIKMPKFVTRNIASEEKFQGKFMPFLVGALTFFLPCGFTITAQTLALTSGNPISGALILLFFSLGTLPILGLISLSSVNLSAKPKLNALFNYVAGVMVVFFGLYNFNAQLNVLGLKSLSDVKLPSISRTQGSNTYGTTSEPVTVDKTTGIQTITMTASGFSYVPTSSMVLKAGVPAKLIVNNKGMQGCGLYMAARGLIDSYVILEPGENVIDLGKPVKGEYKISCTMGMVAPVKVKVI